jgi:glycosyltransferase-like protein
MTGSGNPLRIAMLAHSTNPRGGVVHAIELADSLTRLGHEAVVHAPDANGSGFFRAPLSSAVTVIASPVGKDLADMGRTRIADYFGHFEQPANRRFDIFHAQDAISGNALATLKQRGLIRHFARTVHHIDSFADSRLGDWQTRSIAAADELFVVSALWQERIASEFGRTSTKVGNGVDTARFTSASRAIDQEVRARYGITAKRVLLAVGGIEERKNTLRILEAFQQVLTVHRDAQLVMPAAPRCWTTPPVSGVRGAACGQRLSGRTVRCLGPIPDSDMPSLYRTADALIFPSLKEGFGLGGSRSDGGGTPVAPPHRAVHRISPRERCGVVRSPPACVDRQCDGDGSDRAAAFTAGAARRFWSRGRMTGAIPHMRICRSSAADGAPACLMLFHSAGPTARPSNAVRRRW